MFYLCSEDELLSFNPETTYLNGILYPSNECEPDEYDDETDPITRNEDTHDETKDRVSNNKMFKVKVHTAQQIGLLT